MVSDKGKKPAGKSSGKRKVDEDKTSGARKRRNRGVLQFFEDATAVSDGDGYSSGDSIFDDDFFEEEDFDLGTNDKNDQSKPHNLPVFPKEEEFEEEFDKMMEERYKNASAFLRFAEDEHDLRRFVEEDSSIPSIKDPTTWKVKCAVGRERLSAFCLMQKYVDLQAFGQKLHIISAYAVEHMKGHFFIEAEKQSEVIEACKGLCSIYATRVTPVPRSEVPHLLNVRSRRAEISPGMWARVKNGTYKGDLALVAAVNYAKRRATVKLIPRIDLQALAQKFGGGISLKKTGKRAGAPAPKLISASELGEFRPLIQARRDRDTGVCFENLDGLMLKDGYIYKRVAMDSLNFWGVMPSEEELLKFQPPENNESSEVEWLTQLYGDKKKKRTVKYERSGEKGEGSSGSSSMKTYELFDLVCMGRKDFGLIVGIEKDDYKILKEGAEGHIVQNVGVHEITNGPFEGKFTAMDQHRKPISVNDTVKIMEGPLKNRQGIIKQIYRGIVFIYDDNELENGGYICSRAQHCEKIKLSAESFPGKGSEPSQFAFDDPPSSPKSPLSPEKPWQARENKRDFNQGERDGFSVGQTLRIRIGPLKGYTCRVIGVRRSDVMVKLDSQQKVLTVKSDHLAEVRGRSSASSFREDPDSSSAKPFDLLGNEGSTDWTGGTGPLANDGGWNSGGSSAPWSSWSGVPSSGLSTENNSADPSGFSNGSKQDVEDDGWGSKVVTKQNSSWGTSAADNQVGSGNIQKDGWGNAGDTWNKAGAKGSASGSGSDNWAKAILQSGDSALPSNEGGESQNSVAAVTWGKANDANEDNRWNKQKSSTADGGSSWNSWNKQGAFSRSEATDGSSKGGDGWFNANQKLNASVDSSCDKSKDESDNWTSWKKLDSSSEKGKAGFGCDGRCKGVDLSEESEFGSSAQDKPVNGFEQDKGSSWSKDGGSWKKQDDGSSWGKSTCESRKDEDSSWTKHNAGSWNKTDGGAFGNKEEGASAGGKRDEDSSWSKPDGGSWNSQTGGSKQNVDSSWNGGNGGSWNKQDGGSSWSKSATGGDDAGGSSWNKGDESASWGKQGGSSWGQGDGSSSWSQQTGSSLRDGGNEEQGEAFGGSRGRRGRGGRGDRGRGGQGDRGRFGRGRSFDRDQSSGWHNGGGMGTMPGNGGWRGGGRFGERSCWSSNPDGYSKGGSDNQNQSESWSKRSSFSADGGSSWGKDSESSGGWSNPESWNTPKASDGGGSSWCQPQTGDFLESSGDDKWAKGTGSSLGKNEDKENEGEWKKPEGESWHKKKDDPGADNNWCNVKPVNSWGKKKDNSGEDSNLGNASGSPGGWKKPEGDSWGKKKDDSGEGNDWGNASGSSGGWNKPEGDSWGKKKDDSGANNNVSNVGDSSGGWKKPEGDSWGKKNGDSGVDSKWGNAGDSSGGWKKLEDSWGNKNDNAGAENKWVNLTDSSSGQKKTGGSSWSKQATGGSSWISDKQVGGDCSWGAKQDAGGSSWNEKQDRGGYSSWGSKPGSGGSSWDSKKQDAGGSSWKAGGSPWNGSNGRGEEGSADGGWKSGGGSSWNSRGVEGSGAGWGNGGDGGGGWSGSRDEDQRCGGGRDGRGSWGSGGGRRGRGGFS